MPCWVSPPRPSSQHSLLAGTPASRRSKPPRPTRRCWPHTPRTPRSPPARPRSRAPSTQSSRSSPPCSFPAAELLTRRPGRASQLGSSFAEAASFATCTSWLLSLLRWPTATITADCYSTAGTDAAITAALLAYYTSSQVDTLLRDYRTGTAQDAETTSAITGALLAYYTAAQVDALLGDYRTASAQDTQTQAAMTGPDQDVFTTNQITSALVAYRSAADQDTATASSIAAALLSYYTIAQVDGLLAGKLGVTEAASALQIAVRFPDDGGADEVVAAIGEQDHKQGGAQVGHRGGTCTREFELKDIILQFLVYFQYDTNVLRTRGLAADQPVLIGRAIKRGWASQYSLGEPVLIGQTRIGRAIKRGWGEPSNEVGRASTKGAVGRATQLSQPSRLLQSCACLARCLQCLLGTSTQTST